MKKPKLVDLANLKSVRVLTNEVVYPILMHEFRVAVLFTVRFAALRSFMNELQHFRFSPVRYDMGVQAEEMRQRIHGIVRSRFAGHASFAHEGDTGSSPREAFLLQ